MKEEFGLVSVGVGAYTILLHGNALPAQYDEYVEHAKLVEELDLKRHEGVLSFAGVKRGGEWPDLVVAQRFSPAGFGFCPGATLVPETGVLFLGAGERLLAYDVESETPRKLWQDKCGMGFWQWRQHGDVVVMSAELEVAAFNTLGDKLWSKQVEPPWSYTVADGVLRLDVGGSIMRMSLTTGDNA